MAASIPAVVLERDTDILAAIRDGMFHRAVTLAAASLTPALGRFCYSLLSSRAEAEEAVQDTLVAALRSMSSFRGESSVRTWLFGIARNLCGKRLDARRRQRGRLHLVVVADDPVSGSPDEFASRSQTTEHVRRVLGQLPPPDRDLLALRFGADLSHEEAAEVLGITAAAARQRYSRALAALRERLGDLPER